MISSDGSRTVSVFRNDDGRVAVVDSFPGFFYDELAPGMPLLSGNGAGINKTCSRGPEMSRILLQEVCPLGGEISILEDGVHRALAGAKAAIGA